MRSGDAARLGQESGAASSRPAPKRRQAEPASGSTSATRAKGGADPNIAAISNLDRDQCIAQWRRLFGQAPPRFTSMQLMRQAIAFEAQVKAFGGLSKPVRKAFEAALKAEGQGGNKKPAVRPTQLRPGVHLLREWNGRAYQVEVVEGGFMLDGRKYASLTAIAKAITGVGWSGPRFFGLVKR
jgi:hypothetical protein